MFVTVTGGWCEWDAWSDCSDDCGGGLQTRDRVCGCPSPSGGGQTCPGEASKNRQCGMDPCPGNENCTFTKLCHHFQMSSYTTFGKT